MSLEESFSIGAAGLAAQRTRLETVASNLANANTTRTEEGGPYRRREPLFAATPAGSPFADAISRSLRSVRVERIYEDPSPPVLRFEPGHPHADADGYVAYPNVEPMREMVDMISAVRSYEANVTLVQGVRNMLRAALEIVR